VLCNLVDWWQHNGSLLRPLFGRHFRVVPTDWGTLPKSDHNICIHCQVNFKCHSLGGLLTINDSPLQHGCSRMVFH